MKNKTILPIVLLLSVLSAWFVYDMTMRYLSQELWGYRPLFLLLSAWGAIVLFRQWWRQRKGVEVNWKHLGYATGSGLLLGFGFPGYLPFPFLLFIAFVPLLLVERDLALAKERPPRRRLLGLAYHTFILWNIIATYWVANTALVAGLVAITVNSLLMCIPFLLFYYTHRILPKLTYAAFITNWLVFEYIHLNWDLTWPWLNLGNGFAQFPALVQWYEYTGTFGGSLWILLSNVLLLQLLLAYRTSQKLNLRYAAGVALLLLLPMAASLLRYYTYETQGDQQIEVVVVQPNFEPHYQKFAVPENVQLDRFLALAASATDDRTDYVLFPETSFGNFETDQLNTYPTIQTIRDHFEAYPGLNIITGISAYHVLGPEEPRNKFAREQATRDGRRIYYEAYNAATQITIGRPEMPVYKKSKLVPGAESFPYSKIFFFVHPLVDYLGGSTAGFGPQAQRTSLVGEQARIGAVICYESIFGEYYAGYVRQGAQAIFIMTNDGWWDNTAGHLQHLYFASLRAIETRLEIARSANTGVSAFINQRGDILQPTEYEETTVIKSSLTLNDQNTFYVIWGDFIARIALFTAGLILLNTIVKARMPQGLRS